jgi:hypothetical protein
MTPIPISLAVEDLLSEGVARRLLLHSGKNFAVRVVYNRGGFGYLRKNAGGWNAAARGIPFFLLTDLDAEPCASSLLSQWIPKGVHPNMLARVAVREIESWLLADAHAFASFLGISLGSVPERPETLGDPKAELIKLAAKSRRRDLKRRIVPAPQSTAKQGRDYNSCLIEYVTRQWNPEIAAENAPSLRRCIERLQSFQPLWPESH